MRQKKSQRFQLSLLQIEKCVYTRAIYKCQQQVYKHSLTKQHLDLMTIFFKTHFVSLENLIKIRHFFSSSAYQKCCLINSQVFIFVGFKKTVTRWMQSAIYLSCECHLFNFH